MSNLGCLKVGDKVYSNSGNYNNGKILTITRITKTMIICDKQRYRLDNGNYVGDSGWGRTYIATLTKELEDEVIHHNIQTQLSNFNFRKLSLEDLRKIVEIIKHSYNTSNKSEAPKG